jgi:tRNA-binding protein
MRHAIVGWTVAALQGPALVRRKPGLPHPGHARYPIRRLIRREGIPMADTVSYSDFERLDIRVGTVIDAQPFPEAHKPALRLVIDFGADIGTKRSSAQLTVHYRPDQLIGRQVLGVVNFPPRQIGPFISEVLTLGLPDEDGAVVLLKPDFKVPNGGKMF